jgi:aspartate/methionine/tyrosine aminotransferase
VLSQYIAIKMMQPDTRKKIHARATSMLSTNVELFQDWLNTHPDLFSFVPPKAGGMAFVGYKMDINSTKFANLLRTERSVLIVPGDCYGMDGYLRFGIGSPSDYLSTGLNLVSQGINNIGY